MSENATTPSTEGLIDSKWRALVQPGARVTHADADDGTWTVVISNDASEHYSLIAWGLLNEDDAVAFRFEVQDAIDKLPSVVESPPPEQPAPTAIEPSRVLILDEEEQLRLIAVFNADADVLSIAPLRTFCIRIAYGDEYVDEMDELARTTLRKRRLETEIKRCNMRIEQLTEPVVDKLAEVGARSLTHEASGTRIQRDDQVYLKYADENWSKDEQALARARAGETMSALGGEYAEFIVPTYNSSSVGAFFRERYKAALAEQLDKPEHERRPVTPDDVIPAELREWLTLSVKPRVKVTAV